MVELLRGMLTDPEFIAAHRARPQDFTSERALPFATVVTWLLLNFQSSMRQALQRLLDALSCGRVGTDTKGASSRARAMREASVLNARNGRIVRYTEEGARLARWMGHRLLAVDGSNPRLRELPALAKAFGGVRHDAGVRALARVSLAFDVLNRMVVRAALAPWKRGERALIAEKLYGAAPDDLMLYDRAYPALWLFGVVRTRGAHFCAGIDASQWSRAVELLLHDTDELCYEVRLTERAPHVCAGLGVARTALGVVRMRLATGEYEYLVTSLCDAERYPRHVFAGLNVRRWAVEEAFKRLNCRLTVACRTGKSVLSVEQDFHARVLVMNLTNLFMLEADRRVERGAARASLTGQPALRGGAAARRAAAPVARANDDRDDSATPELSSEPEAVRPGRSYPRDKKLLRRGDFPFAYKAMA